MTEFPQILHNKVHDHIQAIKAYTDQRIREALIEEGVDPEAVARVARRAEAGEFDPPPPTARIV